METVFVILAGLAFIGTILGTYFDIKSETKKAVISWNATAVILWMLLLIRG